MLTVTGQPHTATATRIFQSIIENGSSPKASFTDSFGIAWTNEDNIISGRLGRAFFYLELYRQTSDPAVWEALETELQFFDGYFVQKPSNNYAFLTGRSGFIFLVLEIYRVSEDAAFLHKAVHLLQEYKKSNSFRYGILNAPSLAAGLAGALLVCLHVYQESRCGWIPEMMETHLATLLGSTHTAGQGLYWGGVTDEAGRNAGLTDGASGIAFVLREVGVFFGNDALLHIAKCALAYEDQFTDRPADRYLQNAGMALMRLQTYGDEDALELLCTAGMQYLSKEEGHKTKGFADFSGLGLLLKEGAKISASSRLHQLVKNMSATAAQLIETTTLTPNDLGALGYFLLKADIGGGADPRCVLLPHLPKSNGSSARLNKPSLLTDEAKVYELLGRVDFPKTAALLHATGAAFRPSGSLSLIDDWREHLNEQAALQPDSIALKTLENEQNIWMAKKNYLGSAHPRNRIRAMLEINRHMALGQKHIMSQQYKLADDLCLVNEADDRLTERQFTRDSLIHFLKTYGADSFLIQVNGADNFELLALGMNKLVLDLLTTPRSARSVQERLVTFLLNQPEDVIEFLMKQYHAKNIEDLREELGSGVSERIAWAFEARVIQICS